MKKLLLTVLTCILFVFTAGCTDKAGILLNHQPITEQNVKDFSDEFSPGMRIYYLVLMPKTQNSRLLTLNVYKVGKGGVYGYSQVISRTIRLKDEEIRYYTDYVVINEKGTYVMEIKSYDNPQKTLTQREFYVK